MSAKLRPRAPLLACLVATTTSLTAACVTPDDTEDPDTGTAEEAVFSTGTTEMASVTVYDGRAYAIGRRLVRERRLQGTFRCGEDRALSSASRVLRRDGTGWSLTCRSPDDPTAVLNLYAVVSLDAPEKERLELDALGQRFAAWRDTSADFFHADFTTSSVGSIPDLTMAAWQAHPGGYDGLDALGPDKMLAHAVELRDHGTPLGLDWPDDVDFVAGRPRVARSQAEPLELEELTRFVLDSLADLSPGDDTGGRVDGFTVEFTSYPDDAVQCGEPTPDLLGSADVPLADTSIPIVENGRSGRALSVPLPTFTWPTEADGIHFEPWRAVQTIYVRVVPYTSLQFYSPNDFGGEWITHHTCRLGPSNWLPIEVFDDLYYADWQAQMEAAAQPTTPLDYTPYQAGDLYKVAIESYEPPRVWALDTSVHQICMVSRVDNDWVHVGQGYNPLGIANKMDDAKSMAKKGVELLTKSWDAIVKWWNGSKQWIANQVATGVCSAIEAQSQSCSDKVAAVARKAIDYGISYAIGIPPNLPTSQQLIDRGAEYLAGYAADEAMATYGKELLDSQGITLTPEQQSKLRDGMTAAATAGIKAGVHQALGCLDHEDDGSCHVDDNPYTWGYQDPFEQARPATLNLRITPKDSRASVILGILAWVAPDALPPVEIWIRDNHCVFGIRKLTLPRVVPFDITGGLAIPVVLDAAIMSNDSYWDPNMCPDGKRPKTGAEWRDRYFSLGGHSLAEWEERWAQYKQVWYGDAAEIAFEIRVGGVPQAVPAYFNAGAAWDPDHDQWGGFPNNYPYQTYPACE